MKGCSGLSGHRWDLSSVLVSRMKRQRFSVPQQRNPSTAHKTTQIFSDLRMATERSTLKWEFLKNGLCTDTIRITRDNKHCQSLYFIKT